MNPESNPDSNEPTSKSPQREPIPDHPLAAVAGIIDSETMDFIRETVRRNRQEEMEANWAYYEELERQEQMNANTATLNSEKAVATINGAEAISSPSQNAELLEPKLPYETPDNPWVALEGSIPSEIMDIVRETIQRNRQEEVEANWDYYEELERQKKQEAE